MTKRTQEDVITIGIVDDDPLITQSLSIIFKAYPDISVIWTGQDGQTAIHQFTENPPDVLLLDIRMPHMDGLQVAQRVLSINPDARIIFLTTFADDEYIIRALRLGVRGYLIKQETSTIAPAIRSVMNGQSVFGSEICERLDALMANTPQAASDGTTPHVAGNIGSNSNNVEVHNPSIRTLGSSLAEQLTEREQDIIALVAEGMDNKEIADTLFLSEGTVRNHISIMLQKLGLKNRTQLAIAYYR